MKRFLSLLLCLSAFAAFGQHTGATYVNSKGQVLSKPAAVNGPLPTDHKSRYYDESLFAYRPFLSRTEAVNYLGNQRYQGLKVWIDTVGTFNSSTGVISNGQPVEYVFGPDLQLRRFLPVLSSASDLVFNGKQIKLLFAGDSKTWGTASASNASSGGGGSFPGDSTYPKICYQRLNGANSSVFNSIYINGNPGQTALWFTQNQLSAFLAAKDPIKLNVGIIRFGANDLTQATSDVVYKNISDLCRQVKAAGIVTFVYTETNRKDIYSLNVPNFDTARRNLNDKIRANYRSFANYLIDLADDPLIYSTDAVDNNLLFWATQNDPDGLQKVHERSLGYRREAELAARVISGALGLALPASGFETGLLNPNSFSASSSSTGTMDSVRVLSGNPSTGNIYVNSIDNRLRVKRNGYWYRLAVLDSSNGIEPVMSVPLVVLSSTGVTKTGVIYTPTSTSGGWGNTILWTNKLPAGQDGYLEMSMNHTTDNLAMIGFKTSAVEGSFPTFAYSCWADLATQTVSGLQGGTVVLNGSANTYIQAIKMRLRRIGSQLSFLTSADNFSTILFQYDFSTQNTGDLYPVTDINGNGQLNNPVAAGLQ